MSFPQTLAAAKRNERNEWALADALAAEVDHPSRLHAIAADLGIRVERLRLLYRTALAFPPERRHPSVSWRIHAAAVSPDWLDVIMRSSAKTGVRYTAKEIAAVRRLCR